MNVMGYLFTALACLAIGGLAGYLAALSRRAAIAEEAAQLRTRVAALDATLAAERAAQARLDDGRDLMADQFRVLANDILEEKSRRFTEQNQSNLGQLLDPLKTRLQEFQSKVDQVYVQESRDRSALAQQVTSLLEMNQRLAAEARDLTQALKGAAKTQGDWGEMVLERILEAAGLRRGHEYTTQETIARADASRARPDVILHLPGDRKLVIDAKVSLLDYGTYCATTDEALRRHTATRHCASLREHIRDLAARNYHCLPGLETLDFVILFVPIEPAFLLALETDNNLWVDAWEKNILLVSPSTLLFVVRTVAHLWRQEEQARNVQQIAERGAELYDKFAGFVDDLSRVGARIQQTHDAYNAAFDKLTRGRGNLVRQVEMLRALGVQPTKRLPRQLTQRAEELDIFEDVNEDVNAPGQITAASQTEEMDVGEPDRGEA
ncbi:MAG TPA: DNA recombination protein RmuC [Acidobacteriaceae bacterium]|jgi:DNA recombination protein RmuC|nr:DNA recombination protein RmuC [Acidobacteriaceae bacterium]